MPRVAMAIPAFAVPTLLMPSNTFAATRAKVDGYDSTTAARRNGAVNSSGTAVFSMVASGTPFGAMGFQGLSPAAAWAKNCLRPAASPAESPSGKRG
jgi:hypothetical protein